MHITSHRHGNASLPPPRSTAPELLCQAWSAQSPGPYSPHSCYYSCYYSCYCCYYNCYYNCCYYSYYYCCYYSYSYYLTLFSPFPSIDYLAEWSKASGLGPDLFAIPPSPPLFKRTRSRW